jgi:hypothetical protein
MWIALLGAHLLEAMFFIGILGSTVVVIITSVQDVEELLSSDEHPAAGEPRR